MRYWQIRNKDKSPRENGAPGTVRRDDIAAEDEAFRWLNNYRNWYPDQEFILVQVDEVIVEPSVRSIRAAVKAGLNPFVSKV